VIGLLLLVLALLGLWTTGRMDTTLAGVGLNYHDCVKNAFGATFCGADAKKYEQNVQSIEDSLGGSGSPDEHDLSTAESDVRATVPALEAYYADWGSYAGADDIGYLRTTYDSQIPDAVSLGTATAESYCIEATVGTATASISGPGGTVEDVPC
jgi:hypothetical protein